MLGGTCQNVTSTWTSSSDLYNAFHIARKGCTELVRTCRDDESVQQFVCQNVCGLLERTGKYRGTCGNVMKLIVKTTYSLLTKYPRRQSKCGCRGQCRDNSSERDAMTSVRRAWLATWQGYWHSCVVVPLSVIGNISLRTFPRIRLPKIMPRDVKERMQNIMERNRFGLMSPRGHFLGPWRLSRRAG